MKLSVGVISISILVATFIGCSKLQVGSFVMPSWDTQFSAPIFNRTYTLGEILYKDSVIVSKGDTTFLNSDGPTSVFTLFRSQQMSGTSFAGKLNIQSASANYSQVDSSVPIGLTAPVPAVPPRSETLDPDLPFQNFSSATISSGTISITIRNGYPAAMVFQNGIDVIDPSNRRLIFNIPIAGNSLAANQSYTTSQSLAGITIPDDPEASFTYSSPGSLTPATFETDTLVEISFNMSDISVASVSGQVHLKDPVSIGTDTQKVSLGDFGSKFEGVATFSSSTKLVLNVNTSGGFPSLVHLVMAPMNSRINSAPNDSAVVEQMIYPGQSNSISFGPDFVTALNEYSATHRVIPDEFIISGYVIVNPGPPYASGTVTDNDRVDGTGTISMPFDIGITNATYSDTTKAHGELAPAVSDSSSAAKLGNVDSGEVVIEVNNGLPVQLSLATQLIDTMTHQVVASFPQDSIIIPAASVFNSDGTVSSPVFSRNKIAISHDQAVDLGRCYMKYNFGALTSPNQQTVLLTKNNTISLKVYANLTLRVDKNLVGK